MILINIRLCDGFDAHEQASEKATLEPLCDRCLVTRLDAVDIIFVARILRQEGLKRFRTMAKR